MALATLGPGATYRDLLGAASVSVRDRVGDQHPVGFAEAPASLDEPLFGGTVQLPRSRTTLEQVRGAWWVDAGLVHGIPAPRDGATSVFAVLPPKSREPRELPDAVEAAPGDQPLGHVRVEGVELSKSKVVPVDDWQPAPGIRYPVVLVDLPLPPARVELTGEHKTWAAVRDRLRASPYVREGADDPGLEGDHFRVVPGRVNPSDPTAGTGYVTIQPDDHFLTISRSDASPLTDAVTVDGATAGKVVRRLEHLARWHLVKRLHNPVSTISGKVTIEVVPADPAQPAPRHHNLEPLRPGEDGELHLEYGQRGGHWQPPYVYVYLTNRSDLDLYLTLLALTDRYRCHSSLFPVQLVPAGETAVALTGRPIDVTVPAERLQAGGDTVRDWLKVIASEHRFAPEGYELPNLDGVLTRGDPRRMSFGSVLDCLAVRAISRGAGNLALTTATPVADWTTATVGMRTVHPGIRRTTARQTPAHASLSREIGDGRSDA
jgi:hypothetical protein